MFVCSTTKCHQNKSDLNYVFVQKSFFFNIFSFNPNHAYWNQRRLFSGNLPGMFIINSRTAIAGAIAGLLSVFYYNSKNLNCIGALSFYDSKRSIGEVLF